MTTYNGNAVSNAAIAFQKPITLQQGRAGMRDNLLAFSEADQTAPYDHNAWHPFDGVFGNDGATGRIWSFAVDGAVSVIESPLFQNGYEYRIRYSGLDLSATTGVLNIGVIRDTSGTTAVVQSPTLTNLGQSTFPNGYCEALRARVSANSHLFVFDVGISSGGAVDAVNSPASPFVQVTHATTQRLRRWRLTTSAGNLNAGTIWMDKRRVYA